MKLISIFSFMAIVCSVFAYDKYGPHVLSATNDVKTGSEFAAVIKRNDATNKYEVVDVIPNSGSSPATKWAQATSYLGDSVIAFIVCNFEANGHSKLFFFTWIGPGVKPLKKA